ncbi:hypothetical protein EDC94DRAFT_584238 [Helicostylum pulchrum]|nr:hypothetical protein EDC94DRAFT_584238 [Helicostylum pulchrum]
MEEITLLFMSSISPSDHTTKRHYVKKLTVVNGPTDYNFLNYVSLNFPYLQLLSLNFRNTGDENIEPIKIDMPHTSLDLLTYSERYISSSKLIRLDITCKSLKGLRIRRRLAPEFDSNLVF